MITIGSGSSRPASSIPVPGTSQRDRQQGRRHRDGTERPAGQPPPPLGQPLALLGRAPVPPPNSEESGGDGGRDGERRRRLLLYFIPNGPCVGPGRVSFPRHRAGPARAVGLRRVRWGRRVLADSHGGQS